MNNESFFHDMTRKIAKIEINKIRTLNPVFDFKSLIILKMKNLYKYFDIESDHIIDLIYDFEESSAIHNKEFYSFLENDSKELKENIFYLMDVYFDIINIYNEEIIPFYRISESYNNDHSLMLGFKDITEQFFIEFDLPKGYIKNINETRMDNERILHEKYKMISELPEHKWFNKNKQRDLKEHSIRIKNFIINSKNNETKKVNQSGITNNSFTAAKYNKSEYHSVKLLTKSQCIIERNRAIIKALEKNSHFEKNNFRSMGFRGFTQFIRDSFVFSMTNETIDTIDDDCSTVLNNDDLYTLLSFFPQLGLNGKIEESKFKLPEPSSYFGYQSGLNHKTNNISEYKFSNLFLSVPEKNYWSEEQNKELEEVITIMNSDIEIIFNSKGQPKINI